MVYTMVNVCVIMLCVSISNIISHSNLERMKMFCAFRLHDYCGAATHNCTVYTMMVCTCMCVCPDVCYFSSFFFQNVVVSSFYSFRSTSPLYSCNPLSSILLHYGLSISHYAVNHLLLPHPPFTVSNFSRPFYYYLKWRKQRNECKTVCIVNNFVKRAK